MLPPSPIQTPLQDLRGRITAPWVAWLASLQSAVTSSITDGWEADVSAGGHSLVDLGAALLRAGNVSWQEFKLGATDGLTQSLDTLALQTNVRAGLGDSDAWTDVFRVVVATGALTFTPAELHKGAVTFAGVVTTNGAVSFAVAPTFTDAAGTRSNLGLGSAATQPSSAFDPAGAATTAQAAAIAASLQRASNLSDVANAATARTNLGLGTAATQNTTAFDAAGAWSNWSGDVSANSHNVWGAGIINTAGMQVTSFMAFTGSMFYQPFASTYFTSSNAGGGAWNEFAYYLQQGGSVALDAFWISYNTRSTIGGADVYNPALQIKAVTGDVTLFGPVTISAPQSMAFGSGWLAWSPSITAFGSMTVASVSLTDVQYLRVGPWVFCKLYGSFTLGGTASNIVFLTLPVTVAGGISGVPYTLKQAGSTWAAHWGYVDPSGSLLKLQVNGEGNFTLGSTQVLVSFFYRCT